MGGVAAAGKVEAALRAEKEAQERIGRDREISDTTIASLQDYLTEHGKLVGELEESELQIECDSFWMGAICGPHASKELMLCNVAKRAVLPLPNAEDCRHVWTFATGPKSKAGEIASGWVLHKYEGASGDMERFLAVPEAQARYCKKLAMALGRYVTNAWQMVVSKVHKTPDLRVRLTCSDRALTFTMVWGPEPLLFAMVEEKEFPYAHVQALPRPFSDKYLEGTTLLNRLTEAWLKLPSNEREQLEEWLEGWSKHGLPMQGWKGPEQVLRSMAATERSNGLQVWPADSRPREVKGTAFPLEIEDICPFWWSAEEELDEDATFEAVRVITAFLDQGACVSSREYYGLLCAERKIYIGSLHYLKWGCEIDVMQVTSVELDE